jgi:hexosaminidase
MSWRGVSGAHQAAIAGNDTVLSPQPMLYLDHRQSALPNEPPGRLEPSTLKGVYAFEPLDHELTAAQRRHVLGVQANIWTEHIGTEERVEWMALPRAAAVAEVGWSQRRNWPDFVSRLVPAFARYRAFGLNYADSLFGIEPRIALAPQGVEIALSNTSELSGIVGTSIRYTLDGTDPNATSPEYRSAITAPLGGDVRAATFLERIQASRVLSRHLDAQAGVRRTSLELQVCSDAVGLLLEPRAADGRAAHPIAIDIMNPCWMDRGVDLSRAPQFTAAVAALPFNYELAGEEAKIRVGDAATPEGELEVHADRCDAPVLIKLPLAPAAGRVGVVSLPPQRLPALTGRHDLCLRFARPRLDPLWGLDWVEITE